MASASPRRIALLRQIGLMDVQVAPQDIDETPQANEAPLTYVARMAETKASSAARDISSPRDVVLAADTVVVQGATILRKPTGPDAHRLTLTRLSASAHCVHTAVSIHLQDAVETFVETTDVYFRDLSENEISTYVEHGDGRDKAGGYAIQGGAAHFVSRIDGCYSNVVGLPLGTLIARYGDTLRV